MPRPFEILQEVWKVSGYNLSREIDRRQNYHNFLSDSININSHM